MHRIAGLTAACAMFVACDSYSQLADHTYVVVEGGTPCGVDVPAGDTFRIVDVDSEGHDDQVSARIDGLGTDLPTLDCSELSGCQAQDQGSWDVRLEGIDAHGWYDLFVNFDYGLYSPIGSRVDVRRTCEGLACDALLDAGASVRCDESADIVIEQDTGDSGGI